MITLHIFEYTCILMYIVSVLTNFDQLTLNNLYNPARHCQRTRELWLLNRVL